MAAGLGTSAAVRLRRIAGRGIADLVDGAAVRAREGIREGADARREPTRTPPGTTTPAISAYFGPGDWRIDSSTGSTAS